MRRSSAIRALASKVCVLRKMYMKWWTQERKFVVIILNERKSTVVE
jgi:hypothetical protein